MEQSKMNKTFFTTVVFSSIFAVSGCAGVEFTKSPSGSGRQAGEYFIQEWNKETKSSGQQLPPPEFPATYCGNLAYEIGVQEGWNFDEQLEYSNACTDAIILGLGL
jgi:hypothetical protein